MNPKEALDFVGGLSAPSKMPCHGYSIPATKCITGSKLVNVPGSVCHGCYALKGRYPLANVQTAMNKRLDSISKPEWVDAMVLAIEHKEKSGYFRWHDSGDIQSLEHLSKIAEIAKRLPAIKFWLPTREYTIVNRWFEAGNIRPENLIIRLSAHMIDGPLPTALATKWNLAVSGVHTVAPSDASACPAQSQGNKCLDCRACWNNDKIVSYHKH